MKNKILTITLALAMCTNIIQAKDLSFETMSQAVGILITKVTDIENELAENGNEKSDMASKIKLLQVQITNMQRQIDAVAKEQQAVNTNILTSKSLVTTPKQYDEENLISTTYSVTTNLRIYKEADTASRKLGIYNAGTVVKITEIKNDMALTPRGWVAFNFLEKQGKRNENK